MHITHVDELYTRVYTRLVRMRSSIGGCTDDVWHTDTISPRMARGDSITLSLRVDLCSSRMKVEKATLMQGAEPRATGSHRRGQPPAEREQSRAAGVAKH